ncbi:MAG: glycosyl transferase family 1 [Candidatus Puniceispirillum sp.]|nr:glycosyl transferase family 1 [Candidatus Puniceispirillum sp.]
MLHFKDVTLRLGGKPLLEGVSFHLPKGHRGGLVGRNGAGKTSLFKLITQEYHPDSGDVQRPKHASLGLVAQEIVSGLDLTVLAFVLAADTERARLLEEAATESDPDALGHIHERLLAISAYDAEARAAKILLGLGFPHGAQHKSMRDFSGGWRMRVALACALFLEPDLLLLDEPTNHLDLEASLWLEGYLRSYPRTIFLISHDRTFLNAVCDRIYHLEGKRITFYNGDFDFFEKTRRERLALIEAERTKQDAARAHMQKFIDRFRSKSSKARQVQSRIKQLSKFEPLSTMDEDPLMALSFPEPTQLAPPLMTLDNVSVGYGGPMILKRLNQRLDPQDRIALLGANGNGKTTFAKLLAGVLDPSQGQITRAHKITVGYYHQHQVESLRLDHTAFDHMADLMRGTPESKIRARLGRFGFPGDKADVKVEKLSGGEKARLNFALISFAAPQILILDEPTNHLDIETRESLIFALNAYEGAVILITHDWHLLEMTADQIWVAKDQTIIPFEGTLEDYKREVMGPSGRSEARAAKADTLSKSRADEIREKKQAKKKKAPAPAPKKKKK